MEEAAAALTARVAWIVPLVSIVLVVLTVLAAEVGAALVAVAATERKTRQVRPASLPRRVPVLPAPEQLVPPGRLVPLGPERRAPARPGLGRRRRML